MEVPPSNFDHKKFLKTVSSRPGIYKMFDAQGQVLYVGKAHNLKSRLSSYFSSEANSIRIQVLVNKINDIETIVTNTEVEALLLESNLIKKLKPRYNIVLRDDKSYPYIYLSSHDQYPRLAFDRGKQQGKGQYFGPYPSASAVRQTLSSLQKLFLVRQCEDAFFRNRSRPCLQYQIKRCSAPCVDYVSESDYKSQVDDSLLFLQGKSNEIIETVMQRMDTAAKKLDYESAAIYRDQIHQLRTIYDKQYITDDAGDLDIIAGDIQQNLGCVQVFYIRNGQNLGNKNFFLKAPANAETQELLETFVSQYYAKHEVPKQILISAELAQLTVLERMLSERVGHKVTISFNPKGHRARWLKLAITNVLTALSARLSSQQNMIQKLEKLQSLLELDTMPERLECFDISHTAGEATVASCVVFDQGGPVKSDYRRFNITNITAGDDYAAMHQALERRYKRIKQGEGKLPDILLIDGGKGQVKQALAVFEELQIQEIQIVGVAKGADRVAGQEKLIIPLLDKILMAAPDDPALHLIQEIRDEAHRFAITGHRMRRSKARKRSILEDVAGLGPKRRQQLLKSFGGLDGLKRASVDEISRIKGISRKLAEAIYTILHEN